MKVLFAVNDEKDAEAITRVYQKEYKEIISSKTVYYFNAIIKELQKDKTYDRIVISEDLEMFASDNYQAVDKFIFEKMDAISDEATNAEGNDIPIILLCMDRRTKNDPLLARLFGLGLYNVLVGQDRSVQKVAGLMYKPRSKKEAKSYYKVEAEDVSYSSTGKNDEVSETEIQNILNHYKKIGNNITKCVQSFDSIVSQYNKEQVKLIIAVLPKSTRVILEENSDSYRKIMGIKGKKSVGSSSLRTTEYVEKEIDSGNRLTQPVIIPTAVSTKKVNKVLSSDELKRKKIREEKLQKEEQIKEKQRIAKEQELARKKEEERKKQLAQKKEEARLAREREIAKRKEETRLAKERELARKKEEERLAKEKELARKKEEARLAKEKEMARKKEEARLAKEREMARKKDEEKIAKEKEEKNASKTKLAKKNETKKTKEIEEPVVVKRGRGRPRKNPVEDVSVEDVPIKRKRGRPRKNASVEEEKSENDVKINNEIEEEELNNIAYQSKNKVDDSKENVKEEISDEDIFDFDDLDEDVDVKDNSFDEEDDELDFSDYEDEEDNTLDFTDEDEEDDTFDFLDEDEEDDTLDFTDEDEEDDTLDFTDEDEEDDTLDFTDEDEEDDTLDLTDEDEEDDTLDLTDEDEEDDTLDLTDEDEEDDTLDFTDEDEEDDDTSDSLNEDQKDEENDDLFDFDDVDTDEENNNEEKDDLIDFSEEQDEEIEEDNTDDDQITSYNGSFRGITNRNYKYDSNLANSIKGLKDDDNTDYNFETDKLITSGQRLISFVGTAKNGTSFIINNLAEYISNKGIRTAIVDLTKNKNSYYIYTDNEERLRTVAQECLDKLRDGQVDGIEVNKNLTVFTSLPSQDQALDDVTNIIKTLLENYSLVLLDCDFDTDVRYFRAAQEIYLVQSLDVLTIQPLTGFLRELKNKNILDTNKLRVVINKNMRINYLNDRVLIGGMSVYNDPAMTYMTELFNKDTIKYTTIPFDEQVYTRYLESLVNCKISINGYPKSFISSLGKLADMVFPELNGKKLWNNQNDYSNKNKNFENTFSKNTSSVLNKMKKKY